MGGHQLEDDQDDRGGALLPFAEALSAGVEDDRPLSEAWEVAVERAKVAAQATAQLRPKVGRARPLAERSLGTPDAGAVSLGMCVEAVGGVLAGE